MRIADEIKPAKRTALAQAAWMAVACVLASGAVGSQAFAQNSTQDQRTGVAKPEPVTMVDAPDTQATPPVVVAKPSAAVPAEPAYGPYVPYRAAGTSAETPATPNAAGGAAFNPDASIVGDAPAGGLARRPLDSADDAATMNNPDAGIVSHVPWLPNEVPDGALLKVKLLESISTETTKPQSVFSAEVTDAVVGDGRVYIPAGSILKGRVTWARGGSRISGGATIHLEPRTVRMPDGSELPLHARVIDTNSWDNTKVDSEGTIKRKEHTKGTLAAVGLATGGGAAAGAMIGGVPGALIGAGVGAGVSAVVWLRQDREAVLPKDLGLVFSLTAPMSIAPEKATVTPIVGTTPGGE